MGIQINQQLLNSVDGTVDDELPEGVYLTPKPDEPEWKCPEDRAELFRTDRRIYTAPKRVPGKIVMKYMRAVHNGSSDQAMAQVLYAVLGPGIIDALADEDLTDEEFAQVMKVVEKHTLGATKRILGN